MKRLLYLLLITTILYSNNKFDDIKTVYINGILTDFDGVTRGAKNLSIAMVGYPGKVKPIHNETKNAWFDILETYRYAAFDGTNGGKDFTPFWQSLGGFTQTALLPVQLNQNIQNLYLSNIKNSFLKYGGDYFAVYNQIKSIRDSLPEPKKMMILSHSEGTLVANLVMKRLEEEYGDSAEECTGLISIGTPVSTAVGIRNNGFYTTSKKDLVIDAIRNDVGSLLGNIDTVFDPKNDPLGHYLNEIYLNRGTATQEVTINNVVTSTRPYNPHGGLRAQIINQINTMADRLNQNCIPCNDYENLVMNDIKWIRKYINSRYHVAIADLNPHYDSNKQRIYAFSNHTQNTPPNNWRVDTSFGSNYNSRRVTRYAIDYFNNNIYGLVVDPSENTKYEYTFDALERSNNFLPPKYHGNSSYLSYDVLRFENNLYKDQQRLDNVIKIAWYNGGAHFSDNTMNHFDIWCTGEQNLCNFLKNFVPTDDYTPYGNLKHDWTIWDYGLKEGSIELFRHNVKVGIESYYYYQDNPQPLRQYPPDWGQRFVSWIRSIDLNDCKTLRSDRTYEKLRMEKLFLRTDLK